MSFLKSFFQKEKQIKSNADFWVWFVENEKSFHKTVSEHSNINEDFFDKLDSKLSLLKGTIWFLAGMYNDETAELILTADGSLKNIAFVEELMAEAPKLENWKLTCLKQPDVSNDYGIKMNGYDFDVTTMSFYPINHSNMPDKIDIIITHKGLNEANKEDITKGVYLALDNCLGEINSITSIDNLNIIHPNDSKDELIPLEKLRDYLIWREKEFINKYQGIRTDTSNDNYQGFEGNFDGSPMFAVINTDLINWDSKASHPWFCIISLKYDGSKNNGLPDNATYKLMDDIEDKLRLELNDFEGYLNIGRETANNQREIYFACKDFRKPSKILFDYQQEYKSQIDFSYDIYKDKYWQSLKRFVQS